MIFDAEAADLEAFPPPPETRLRASVRRCRGSGRCRSSAAGLGVVVSHERERGQEPDAGEDEAEDARGPCTRRLTGRLSPTRDGIRGPACKRGAGRPSAAASFYSSVATSTSIAPGSTSARKPMPATTAITSHTTTKPPTWGQS